MILTSEIMKTIPEAIRDYALGTPEGQVLSPKEFLHLGSRTAVDQALSRLSREGYLIRVDRGAYVAPVQSRSGIRPPSAEKVVESLATLSGELIAPDGPCSAMALGLADQGPAIPGYVTSGRSRTLLLGAVEVVLQHAPAWMLILGDERAGAAIRAMAWLGPDVVGTALVKIRSSLSSSEWSKLVASRPALPCWMARAIGETETRNVLRRDSRRLTLSVAEKESSGLYVDAAAPTEVLFNQTMGAA